MDTIRPELTGTFGMATSTHYIASAVGMSVLEAGGNAFDAAAAMGLVLHIAEPHMNGPAGEAPVIGWDARSQQSFVVSGQGVAPAAATIGAYRDLGLDLVPGTGFLAACVPGAFGAWLFLLLRRGTMRLGEVMSYAIEYAGGGIPLLERTSETIASMAPLFAQYWPTSEALWLPGGRVPRGRFANRELAETYERLLREAEEASGDRDGQIQHAMDAFYEGFVAEAMIGFAGSTPLHDVTGERHTTLLTRDDLAAWRPSEEPAVSYDYRGYTVLKPGPWTQGPVFLQQLALLDGCDLDSLSPTSPELVHLIAESAKLAFADREAYYGDPRGTEVPLDELLSVAYNDERRALVGEQAYEGLLRPGSPGGRVPRLPRPRAPLTVDSSTGAGEPVMARLPSLPMVNEGGLVGPLAAELASTNSDTCHLDVVDRWGNMASATPSGGWLQGSPAIPGLGFALGTRAQIFWLDEGVASSLGPGLRPRTTLSPMLVLRDGRPAFVMGTPGGDQQDQWTIPAFIRYVHYGMTMQEAIEAPAFHVTHFPSSFYPRSTLPGSLHLESRWSESDIAWLRARGHTVAVDGPWALGKTSAISRSDDGLLRASASPRGFGVYAAGR